MTLPLSLLVLSLVNMVLAGLPHVDFNRMGKVGLAGSFVGLDLFNNSTTLAFDPSTSTLLSRSSAGSLSRLASTNSGGQISAGCSLGDVFYFAGSFSSIGNTSASNIASYTPSSSTFAALGSGGPNGEVDAVFCDEKNSRLWVGGSFASPSASVAIWNTKNSSWSSPPFSGLSGAQSRVLFIGSNTTDTSLIFAGSFITSFQGNGSLNHTNNPNVPYSVGATPFSSSLVPIPLQNAQIQGSPSSSTAAFSDIANILCPSGPDGPGNTWLAADGNTAVITIRTFTSMSASGVRLGNTFLAGYGTTAFSVTTIPDNTVQALTYVDLTTSQNQTCTSNCPLSTDASVPYQDFLFDGVLDITGIQVDLSEWTGSAPGLHLIQLLSSGAFASAVPNGNAQSCFAPNPSNTSSTGSWIEKIANTNISGTVESILTASVDVGTPAAAAPTFTWMPYVSAAGQYTINLLVPGCTNFQDCPLRTTAKVTVFPGQGLEPWVTTVSEQNTDNAAIMIYNGPILPSTPNFVTTITLTLADNPAGQGEDGQYELVADHVQMILLSADTTSNGGPQSTSGGGTAGGQNGFGFFEWSLSASPATTKVLPNSTETSLDAIGFAFYSSVGGSEFANAVITTVAHHPSGVTFLAGNFSLASGPASGATNIVAFRNGALSALPGNGLNGPVTSSVMLGDSLFVGGAFDDSSTASLDGQLGGIAMYDVNQNSWVPLQAGVDGPVASLSSVGQQVQVAGNFTKLLASSNSSTGEDAPGFAVWDVKADTWVNSGGYVVGAMTFVGNGSDAHGQTQFIAGNVVASLAFGATGFALIQNGDSSGPNVTPLGVKLDNSSETPLGTSPVRRGLQAWMEFVGLPALLPRQTTNQLLPLPPLQPASSPSVFTGGFWTNASTSHEVVILGGDFSFTSRGSSVSQAVAIYDPEVTMVGALQGPQINGSVLSLLVQENMLYLGGEFTLPGATVNGFAVYDLLAQSWVISDIQPLQTETGTTVVRSVTASSAAANTVIVAGSFSKAGSLPCQSICAFDTITKQWSALGDGIQGDVASVDYAGNNQVTLIASGSIALSDNSVANVAQFSLRNNTWSAVGLGSHLPGPVTAVTVNNANASSIFAAGRSSDGSSFLSFWNGVSWMNIGSALQGSMNVSQLTMVPLQDDHAANGVIEPDRMLMISGSLEDSSFGNVSSALFDGQTIFPYIISTSSLGTPGTVYSLFYSFSSFSFVQHYFLATGIVILISIAIAAGVVFLLALTGILWTLFSRRDDKANKMDANDYDDDDESSQHHRPSSLLEHINMATRTTILGASNPFTPAKEEEKADTRGPAVNGEPDLFGPDASNYVRAETPSDAVGGILSAEEETSRPAHARYSFDGSGEGELPLSAGMEVEVLDDRDAAWWFARDVRTGKEGVVPAAYLY